MARPGLNPKTLAQILAASSTHKKYLLAYSGGLDSHVLLHLMANIREHSDIGLRAIYVNHGLQKQAGCWAKHCGEVCAALSVPYDTVALGLQETSGESLEALARHARYQVLAEALQTDEVLLTAQHGDDQAETLLLQLFRGAGVDGLAAMPSCTKFGKGLLMRPLLDYSRRDIETYAQANQLNCIQDPSNQDQRFDRNFLRQSIMPQLQQRWQGISNVLSRVAEHQAEAKSLLDEYAAQDLEKIQNTEKDQLLIPGLLKLSKNRQKLLVRYWIKQQGYLQLSAKKLAHLFSDVIGARVDAAPVISWTGSDTKTEIRRYQDRLYIMEALAKFDASQVIPWDLKQPLYLEEIGVTLYPEGIKGSLPKTKGAVTVRFRQGGETIYSPRQGMHVPLKKLFQDAEIPPWWRSRVPLLYKGEQLVFVPGFPVINHKEDYK